MNDVDMRYAIGIDFGGTSVKMALISERGQIVARRKFVTQEVQGPAGWHVLRLVSRRAVEPPPFASVRDRLYAELPPGEEIVSGPVGNGSIDNPTCTIRYAAPPG